MTKPVTSSELRQLRYRLITYQEDERRLRAKERPTDVELLEHAEELDAIVSLLLERERDLASAE